MQMKGYRDISTNQKINLFNQWKLGWHSKVTKVKKVNIPWFRLSINSLLVWPPLTAPCLQSASPPINLTLHSNRIKRPMWPHAPVLFKLLHLLILCQVKIRIQLHHNQNPSKPSLASLTISSHIHSHCR